MHLADEVLDHFFRHFEIRDHAISQGANGRDIPRRAAKHQLRFLTHRQHLLAATLIGNGDHARLIQNDAPALHIDQRIRGAEVNGHIGGKEAE
jgi:hypothetical protein